MQACKKNDLPPEGLYLGTFSGIYSEDGVEKTSTRLVDIQITETSKNELVLWHSEIGEFGHESILTKESHDISGTIATWASWATGNDTGHITYIYEYIDVVGRWEKQGNEYIVTGSFNYIYHFINTFESVDASYPVKGTFIIEPRDY